MANASVRLLPVSTGLPSGFGALRDEARAEGYRFLDRLASDWQTGANRFGRPGERLLAAEADGMLAAIGGLTVPSWRAPFACAAFTSDGNFAAPGSDANWRWHRFVRRYGTVMRSW